MKVQHQAVSSEFNLSELEARLEMVSANPSPAVHICCFDILPDKE